jgi:hypothetical protein
MCKGQQGGSFIPPMCLHQCPSITPHLWARAGAKKVMELKGHKGQVMSVAFSPDNTRAVTVSKDNTMRIWNIDVRWVQGTGLGVGTDMCAHVGWVGLGCACGWVGGWGVSGCHLSKVPRQGLCPLAVADCC